MIHIEGITRTYSVEGQHIPALAGVDLHIGRNEYVALIGPSGSGKSTLMNLIGCLDTPSEGTYVLNGRDTSTMNDNELAQVRNQEIGFVFQSFHLLPRLTVLENVQMALLSADRRIYRFWRPAGLHRPADALALLAQVGMQAQADRPCSALAYGDVKRVELAMALAHSPRLLLMDEPTAGMAPAERQALMALTRQIARERRMGVLFTEHSMDVVFGQADRVLVLEFTQMLKRRSKQQVSQ